MIACICGGVVEVGIIAGLAALVVKLLHKLKVVHDGR